MILFDITDCFYFALSHYSEDEMSILWWIANPIFFNMKVDV